MSMMFRMENFFQKLNFRINFPFLYYECYVHYEKWFTMLSNDNHLRWSETRRMSFYVSRLLKKKIIVQTSLPHISMQLFIRLSSVIIFYQNIFAISNQIGKFLFLPVWAANWKNKNILVFHVNVYVVLCVCISNEFCLYTNTYSFWRKDVFQLEYYLCISQEGYRV